VPPPIGGGVLHLSGAGLRALGLDPMTPPKYHRGRRVPPEVSEAVRALILARGAERAVRLIGLSPLAIASLAAGAYVTPATLARARHYLEHGHALPRERREPEAPRSPEAREPEAALPSNVVRLRPLRAL